MKILKLDTSILNIIPKYSTSVHVLCYNPTQNCYLIIIRAADHNNELFVNVLFNSARKISIKCTWIFEYTPHLFHLRFFKSSQL